jgi:anti-sigma B factor antagonist
MGNDESTRTPGPRGDDRVRHEGQRPVVLPDRDDASPAPMRPPPDRVELTITCDDRGRHVLHVIGEIDLATVSALRDAIEQLVRDADGSAVIDLSEVGFMDCQGIAALFEAAGRAHAVGIGLSAIASPACERLVGLTGLRSELDMYDCVDDAP